MDQQVLNSESRYETLGMPLPDPCTVCQGQCEGTGWFPLHPNSDCFKNNPRLRYLWHQAHKVAHTRLAGWDSFLFFLKQREFRIAWNVLLDQKNWDKCDGWHFIRCPDCGGTGKQNP